MCEMQYTALQQNQSLMERAKIDHNRLGTPWLNCINSRDLRTEKCNCWPITVFHEAINECSLSKIVHCPHRPTGQLSIWVFMIACVSGCSHCCDSALLSLTMFAYAAMYNWCSFISMRTCMDVVGFASSPFCMSISVSSYPLVNTTSNCIVNADVPSTEKRKAFLEIQFSSWICVERGYIHRQLSISSLQSNHR